MVPPKIGVGIAIGIGIEGSACLSSSVADQMVRSLREHTLRILKSESTLGGHMGPPAIVPLYRTAGIPMPTPKRRVCSRSERTVWKRPPASS